MKFETLQFPFKKTALLCLALFAVVPLFAVTKVWLGVTSEWYFASNWDPIGPPGETDDVQIQNGLFFNAKVTSNVNVKSVVVISGSTLEIEQGASLNIMGFGSVQGNTHGFRNEGTVTINGTLQIGSTASAGQRAVINLGSISIASTGLLRANNSTSVGVLNFSGGTMVNGGTLEIGTLTSVGPKGIENQGIFKNQGQLKIDRSTSGAIHNYTGNFQNLSTIAIGANADVGAYGIENEATFANMGQITIDRSAYAGLNNEDSGSFSNMPSGSINIGQSVGTGSVLTFGTFNNAGSIAIDRSTEIGLYNGSGTFTNTGYINIGQNPNGPVIVGHGLQNDATFNNNTGGQIQIDRCTDAGLYNSFGTFTNAATIIINTSTSSAYGLSNESTFNNNSGTISINRATTTGLNNNFGTFTNAATITIGATQISGWGIQNSGTVNNNACGVLSTFAPIENGAGKTLTNAGLLTVNTSSANTNGGTVTNNGILSYPQGNPIPSVVNNKIIARPISGCTPLPNALTLGNTTGFTIGTTWYLNQDLTGQAGTYNATTNRFTNTALSINTPTTVYFSVTAASGGCSRTVSVKVTITGTATTEMCNGLDDDCDGIIDNVVTSCGPAGTRTWTGLIGTDWNTPCNWNPSCVPTAADDVVIADVTNDPIISGAVAAKSLVVNTGGVLTLAASGTLTINGSTAFNGSTTALGNSGTVVNNGTIAVGSTSSVGQVGILNMAAFTNNTGAQIRVDRSSSIGLHNSTGGTFTNKAAVTIGANAGVGPYGIQNDAVFNNNACGQLSMTAPLNNTASFTNAGAWKINSASANTNTGTVTNNGIVEYVQGNPMTGTVENNEIVAQPQSGGCFLSNVLGLGSPVDFAIGTTWYLNPNLSGQAGTYNQATNTFTNTNVPANTPTTVYFSVNDAAGGCTRTVAIRLTASGIFSTEVCNGLDDDCDGAIDDVAVSCGTAGTRTWTGAVNTDWNTACNWSPACVPTAEDNVVIAYVSNMTNPVIGAGTAVVAKSVVVNASAVLTIAATGSLTVNGSTGTTALDNSGTVHNNGTVTVGSTTSPGYYGIYNQATFNNNAGGQINIDRSTLAGLYNYAGTFTNAATITIGANASVGSYGISNNATFNNNACAVLSTTAPIQNYPGKTITNAGLLTLNTASTHNNVGTLTNNGILSYPKGNPIGGTVTNNEISANPITGDANISPALSFGTPVDFTVGATWYLNANLTNQAGTYNQATNTFTNTNLVSGQPATVYFSVNDPTGGCARTAAIRITFINPCAPGTKTWTGTTSTDWNTASNWNPACVPTATSDVVIPNTTNQPTVGAGTGAVAKSVVVNASAVLTIAATGSLTIDGSSNIALSNNGTVTNNGTISIGSTNSVGTYGIWNQSTFNNNTGGQITIDRSTDSGLYNYGGTFTNAATITIGSTTSPGFYGIYNYATFNNNTGGQITIDRPTDSGLYNYGGTFTNAATITIGASASTGSYGISNNATFNNNAGGQISIDRSTGNGLNNSAGTFTNAATITIGANASVGTLGIKNNATFNNNVGGQINIDRSTTYGLNNSAGTFTNAATITIGANASVGSSGLYNNATFNNNACAMFYTTATLYNGTGKTITNTGLLTLNTTSGHGNFGTLTNNGILSYPQGSPIPGVTNNEISTNPITGGNNISPALSFGTPVDFTVGTTWYLDANLTNQAGTYNQATNTFTNTNLVSGQATTVYFSVNDPTGGCTRTAAIRITYTDPCLPGTKTWTGTTSTDWNTAANWNPACVPSAADNVVIANTTNKPTIGAGTTAVAKSVLVNASAVLTVAATGSLTINGSTNIALSNNGTVTNDGTINIGSTTSVGSYGIYNNAAFNNNTGGQINIDRSTNTGLYNAAGTITNAANITIGASASVGSRGIINYATFNNNAGGQINIDRLIGIGLAQFSTGTFTNVANITIGAIASVGTYGLYNEGTFNNNAGGQINIDSSTNTGLNNAAGTFTNAANITIGASASVGTNGIYNNATFNNNAGGQINIDRSTAYGLYNYSGTFTNAATITIGANASVGNYGLSNYATFNNNTCGVISTTAPLQNVSGKTITNAGLFTLNTTSAHSNAGTVINNGILSYPQGNLIGGTVTNNEISANPTSGGYPALSFGTPVDFTVGTTWYLDANLTNQPSRYLQPSDQHLYQYQFGARPADNCLFFGQ